MGYREGRPQARTPRKVLALCRAINETGPGELREAIDLAEELSAELELWIRDMRRDLRDEYRARHRGD